MPGVRLKDIPSETFRRAAQRVAVALGEPDADLAEIERIGKIAAMFERYLMREYDAANVTRSE